MNYSSFNFRASSYACTNSVFAAAAGIIHREAILHTIDQKAFIMDELRTKAQRVMCKNSSLSFPFAHLSLFASHFFTILVFNNASLSAASFCRGVLKISPPSSPTCACTQHHQRHNAHEKSLRRLRRTHQQQISSQWIFQPASMSFSVSC